MGRGAASSIHTPRPLVLHFGVHGTVRQAERGHGPPGRRDDLRLRRSTLTRRCDVQRLFKERAVKRIGFVEQRQRPQNAAGDDPFERELAAGDEFLHLDEPVLLFAPHADIEPGEQLLYALEGGYKLRLIVGANHAAAARKAERFEHAGERRAARGFERTGLQRHAEICRNVQAGGTESFARQILAAASLHGRRRMKRNAQPPGGQRGQERRAVAHRDDSVEGAAGFEQAGVTRAVVEAHRDGAVGPRVIETVALVGGENGFGAGPPRGLRKRAGLVAGGRRQDEDTLRHPNLSVGTSADTAR
jgi:hypothetical protein